MKLATLTPFIGLIAQISASTIKGANKDYSHLPTNDMTFIGQITVGGPNVTLTGTAESIYDQVLELNPAYDPMDFEEFRARKNSTLEVEARGLEKRDWINCNVWGDKVPNPGTNCPNSVRYLRELNGWCGTGAYSCARTICRDACGIHICNDNNFGISVWCGNLAGDFFDIMNECVTSVGSVVTWGKGQIYRDQAPKWNTVVNHCK